MNFIEEKILEKGNLDKLKLRFPPEPNGAILNDGRAVGGLHLGHAKSICLNFGLAEKYNAPCVLRFDDTNPSTEKTEFVNSMIEDVKWLGFNPSEIRFTSDYFSFLYDCAVTLIKKGLAYVDDSTSEEIARLKGTPTISGTISPYYSRSVEENLDLFERMRLGEFAEGSRILRAKIDMSSPNMILRDPVLYRIIEMPHHRTGDGWKIYPMYDFAHPLSDYIEGITDSLCTLEFEVHRPLYMWVLENCDLENPLPEETEFARLNIDWTVMSKRKLKRLVEEGFVSGWDDPRMPTISGLRRRGFTPTSIREFCDRISVTKRESVVSYTLLEECLRGELNKTSNRLMGVFDPIKLVITNWNGGTEMVPIENNPEDETSGMRDVPFSGEIFIERDDFREESNAKYHRLKLGGEVRLKGAYVVKANEVIKDSNGEIIEVRCTYDPLSKSGMVLDRKIKGTIHWVSCESAVRMSVNEYDRLFIDSDPDKGDEDFINFINTNSLVVNKLAVFEPEVRNCKVGIPVQMMRKGYYVLDLDGNSLNRTVSLKEGWVG
jgi:glutaminyl-tRNA synthetase